MACKESRLLEMLIRSEGGTLDRSVALLKIWGDDGYHCSRSMDVFVSRLRKYLADDPRITIKTLHGRGLRLLVD